MDFGDFITLILFIVFIVSPFLKRKKIKQAQKPVKSKQSGFSVLGKISQALKEAAREMEAQAEQARKKEATGKRNRLREGNNRPFDQAGDESVNQTFWDKIDDRKDVDFSPEKTNANVLAQIEPVNEKPLFMSAKKEPHRKAPKIPETRDSKPTTLKHVGHGAMQIACPRKGHRHLPARVRGLQKAVIWSEILGKPVALRD
ncbi:hypothetical protein [uncultured Desulfobacter sp.]|uniref:hypothetical protein n=1 Tax=uncultured Desulfobacter sp. TaxID=240139 RepID=UPI002AABC900|nr:hypothetical protein [uncultured Desulfobacter sp.]